MDLLFALRGEWGNHLQIEIARYKRGDAIDLDREISPAVAVHVALDNDKSVTSPEVQFSRSVVEALRPDELELLVP
jgi:hypothetical protein